MNPQAFSTFPFGTRTKTIHSPPAVCPPQSSVYYYLFKVPMKVCVYVCVSVCLCVGHAHAGVAPFAILSVHSGHTSVILTCRLVCMYPIAQEQMPDTL